MATILNFQILQKRYIMNKMETAQQLLEQMNETQNPENLKESKTSLDELQLKIVMEIITEYKKITAAIEASAVKQEKFHGKMKMSFLEKTNELKKSINYARTINFYIALFSMSAIILFLILYLIIMM